MYRVLIICVVALFAIAFVSTQEGGDTFECGNENCTTSNQCCDIYWGHLYCRNLRQEYQTCSDETSNGCHRCVAGLECRPYYRRNRCQMPPTTESTTSSPPPEP